MEEESKSYSPGEVIFLEGEESDDFYIIKSGKVRIVKEVSKRLIPITVLREQEFLGEMSLFDDKTRSAHAIALEPTEIVKLDKKDLQIQFGSCPQWIQNIMKTLAERLRSATDIVREHRIVDSNLSDGKEFTSQDEVQCRAKIKEYLEKKES